MTPHEEILSASIFRLRRKTPFFGALALFLRYGLDEGIPTACTDGSGVLFNPSFIDSLAPEELDAVMVHELLHAALLHVPRRGQRDPLRWNIAADIVVNGMIRKDKALKLPANTCVDPKLENLEVEEVYELLDHDPQRLTLGGLGADLRPAKNPGEGQHEEIKAYWGQSLQQAALMARMIDQGSLPDAIERLIAGAGRPQVDWRSTLWRFLVSTPVDFSGFDRRLIGRGIYLEALDGESASVGIAIDTSGSVPDACLAAFLAEVREILRIYPRIDCELYYADAALHGPFAPDHEDFEKPVGGGGTSFVPFFEAMDCRSSLSAPGALIYLTDGYGTFPKHAPDLPVLWVVAPGGRASKEFPFGSVVRLV